MDAHNTYSIILLFIYSGVGRCCASPSKGNMGTVSGGGLHNTTGAAVVAWSVRIISVVVSFEAVSSTTASRVVHALSMVCILLGWFRDYFTCTVYALLGCFKGVSPSIKNSCE